MGRRSLFARKLRAFRAGAGAGTQGRMTQEQLADLLGVSVEAVSAYERSASYVRGDFEARFVERLGWSPAEMAACRADWDAHHLRPRQGGYRLLGAEDVARLYGGSYAGVARAITQLVIEELPEVAGEFGANDDLWVPIIERFAGHGQCVLRGDRMVGHWGMQFLDAPERARFRDRFFKEAELSADRLLRPILPGAYYGYCPIVVIAKGHEAAAPLLLGSVQCFLEELAERGVVLEALGAVGVTADGRQLARQLGFTRLGPHREIAHCDVWELPGPALATSILGRRSAFCARRTARARRIRGLYPGSDEAGEAEPPLNALGIGVHCDPHAGGVIPLQNISSAEKCARATSRMIPASLS